MNVTTFIEMLKSPETRVQLSKLMKTKFSAAPSEGIENAVHYLAPALICLLEEQKSIEVNNETDKPVLVSVCRTKGMGRLYVHIGKVHGDEVEVAPNNYAIVEIKEREW